MFSTVRAALRKSALALCLVLAAPSFASADVRVGIHLDLFPDLVPVPGYPVYYAPQIRANFFFYDGEYWLYDDDDWYVSHWYDGPWEYVDPYDVPVYVLRVPVRYYRVPPPYFRGWAYDAPPRWGYHWGPTWAYRRSGWDHWDRHHAPPRAPLPSYQRKYSGDRYPDRDQQRELRDRFYDYRPREPQRVDYRRPREDRDERPRPDFRQPPRPERNDFEPRSPREHREPPRPERNEVERREPARPEYREPPRQEFREPQRPDYRQPQRPDYREPRDHDRGDSRPQGQPDRGGDRPRGDRPQGDRLQGDRPQGENPRGGDGGNGQGNGWGRGQGNGRDH